MPVPSKFEFGAVAIGRNEGERLKQCLASLSAAAVVVYVDSGSTDGSAEWARGQGAEVIDLDRTLPFTAARARNAGFGRLRELSPELAYVQFVDGDCELVRSWPERAVSVLERNSDIGAICGRRRERYLERSIYNWLCDLEWDGPAGEVRACGGDVMLRIAALDAVGGYRADLIAGEDPELCVRLRESGWRIWRLDDEMTIHDAAMTRLSQWWWRAVRAGFAFAQGASLHGDLPERYCVWETRRAWLFGMWLPSACLVAGLFFGPWGWATWLIYPLHMVQKVVRGRGPLKQRVPLALFHVLGHFPQSWGAAKFTLDRVFARRSHLIEYK